MGDADLIFCDTVMFLSSIVKIHELWVPSVNDKQKGPVLPGAIREEGGWTFIESIIVIAIVIILTGSAGIAGIRYVDRARVSATMSEISSLGLALDSYYLDNGAYPTQEQGLEALWSAPSLPPVPEAWAGPYVSKDDFTDSWDRDYLYAVPGPEGLPYSIRSLGADDQEGGEGKDADILSWEG